MGHTINLDREYRLLQQQLDRKTSGAPDSVTLTKILKLLYTPDEAQLARRMPEGAISIDELARKLGFPADELDGKLTEMARKGVMMDLECNGKRYFRLPPVVLGFFEFTFMRARDDLPMAELARLFEEYFYENDSFFRSVSEGQTQLFRPLVREESIPCDDYTEILDWERASHIVQSATSIAVGLCQCHHSAMHLGKACDKPREVCLMFNYAAQSMVRNGLARPITVAQAMNILEQCKEAGLAQTADNVQKNPTFMCNCCGCCCHIMRGIRTFGLHNAVFSSNWIMEVDASKCNGCGDCLAVCPVQAIGLVEQSVTGTNGKVAKNEEDICLGCGVCYSACKHDAVIMKSRPRRVFTPKSAFDKIIVMAIERGKLADLIFSDPQKLSHRAMGRVLNLLEKSPPYKAAMAIEPLKSAYLSTLVRGARWRAGEVGDLVTEPGKKGRA